MSDASDHDEPMGSGGEEEYEPEEIEVCVDFFLTDEGLCVRSVVSCDFIPI